MALVVKDRVKELSTTTGTGSVTLAGAADGFQSFASALSNGDTTYYAIIDAGTGDFEIGLGTYSAGVLSRDTILESSNAGLVVNLQAGEKEVFVTYPAEKAVYYDGNGSVKLDVAEFTVDTATGGQLNVTGNILKLNRASGPFYINNDASGGSIRIQGRDIAVDGAKLDGIEAGATADQTKADIDALGINAATLGGNSASYFTGYTDTAISNLVSAAPGTLDTLNELAAALGDDPNFATTVTNSIATKLSLSGGTMTGNLSSTAFIGTTQTSATPSVDDARFDGFGVQGNRTTNPVYLHNWGNGGVRISSNASLGTANGILVTDGGLNVTGNIVLSGTVDGRDVSADGTKLDGIEAGATADQTITAGAGLTGGGTGDVTISHADTSTQVSVNNSGATVIQDVTLDTYGHVTGLASTTLTAATVGAAPTVHTHDDRYYTEAESDSRFVNVTGDTMTGNLLLTASSPYIWLIGTSTSQYNGGSIYLNNGATTGNYGVSFSSQIRDADGTDSTFNCNETDSSGNYLSNIFSFDHETSTFTHAKYSVFSNGVSVSGNITVGGTVDGRDVATDGAKLDGIEAGATADQTAAEILTAIKTVDGSGSGLDADLLDGQHGSYYYSPANAPDPTLTINGDASGSATFTNLGNATLTLTVADDSHNHSNYTPLDHMRSTGNSYHTSTTTAALLTEVLGDGAFNSYFSTHKTGWSYAGNGDLTDAGRLTELAGTSWAWWTDNSADGVQGNVTGLVIAPNTGGSAGKVFIYNNQGSGYDPGWREVWTSRSDGSGSGLDADLLDGQHGSYYAPISNPTFTGTVTATAFVGDGSVSASSLSIGGNVLASSTNFTVESVTSLQNLVDVYGDFTFFGDIYGGDIVAGTGGNITTIGTVTANAFVGDGSGLTGISIPSTYMTTNSSNTVTSGFGMAGSFGNIFTTNGYDAFLYSEGALKLQTRSYGVQVTGQVYATSFGVGSASLSYDGSDGTIASTKTVKAPAFVGDGSGLTNLPAASAKNDIFWENGQTVTTNYTITNGKNAMSAGPITINSGVTVTVGAGETWTVV